MSHCPGQIFLEDLTRHVFAVANLLNVLCDFDSNHVLSKQFLTYDLQF